ncbi:16597_t:CDS:1 [Acaulospora morrowiae]|uniref:16597_t:CDS:1 n=1 Tax=Acaulospora morrowiae TaxID=94023 RepID=A0A9N8YQ87_9GLOM|nr:16597_t:CDS:1 [Acaulospora morrowiae]
MQRQKSKTPRERKRSSLMAIQKQQEENVAILANTKGDGPIYQEINSVMIEIEKFRARLHELSRVQEQQYESDGSEFLPGSQDYEERLEINEKLMQAVQNQLAVVRQHISNIMDNYEFLDENLLTVIMTYNEEVNIALQEALQEVPSLYQHQPPESSIQSEDTDFQRTIEAQAIQIYFLEKSNFNNILQLINDIDQCQELLLNFTKLKGVLKDGGEYELSINVKEVKELLCQYECKTQIDEGYQHNDWIIQFVSGLLQRHILVTILDHSDIYFNGSFHSSTIETKRESFLGRTKFTDFAKPLSKMNPEVYTVLGSKGYDGFDHPFVEFVSGKIVNIMNQCCIIESLEKQQQIKELASDVVHSVINIFYFRMQAQDPPSQFRWVENGANIEPETMGGVWDSKFDDLIVDLNYFPIIGRKLLNQDKLKVYSKAKVCPYRQPGSFINSLPGAWSIS